MKKYNITRARVEFAEIINLAAYGKETVILEKHGKAVAAVVPMERIQAPGATESHPMGQVPIVPLKALKALCKKYRVHELLLFGSAARGEMKEGSDIDLLVEFMPSAKVGFMMLAGMQNELAALFGRKVDLVTKSGLKPSLREKVLSETKLLYAA